MKTSKAANFIKCTARRQGTIYAGMWSVARLHHSEVGAQQAVDVGRRQEAAELASAPAWRAQLPDAQRHAALEQPRRRQTGLIRLQAQMHRHSFLSSTRGR